MPAVHPTELGRSVVVASTQPAPPPWGTALRVEVDEASLARPTVLVEQLHRAWMTRKGLVISLAVDPSRFRQPAVASVEPWTLDPRFELYEDRLHFLVWANSYDARSRSGPPVWWWARKAVRLGAVAGSHTDITLSDGRSAWVDGGPRGGIPSLIEGAVVIHRESVERNRLTVMAPIPTPLTAGLADLAPDQWAAVTHPSGPARIIAPAGSGKTRVLTERLRYLIETCGWERDSVMAVAYNKKAREELDARCAGLGSRTRTLNSLGLWLLTTARGSAPQVLDERATRRIVERLAPTRRHRANTDPIGPYLEGLSTVRLGLVDPEVVEAERDDVPGLAALLPAYRQELAEMGAVDFDEQIYAAIEVLVADGEFRQRVQLNCRHLLVDEFQDLTPAHVLMLRLLASPILDVFGVGDDDQVIYGHAGADPAFLIDYAELFPGASGHPLEVNYRCPPDVVTAASHLLSHNRRRVSKAIRAGRSQPPPGEPAGLLITHHAPSAGAATVVAVVEEWLRTGSADDVAVLSRVNSLLLAPQVALAVAGIPMSSVLRPEVLDRTGLRAALAYLRLATAEERSLDARDLVEILRRPSRGLPPWFAERLRRRSTWSVDGLLQVATTIADKDATKVENLVDDLVVLRTAVASGSTTDALVRAVRDEVGLGRAMSLLDQSRGAEGSSHLDDLEALEQVAALHPEPDGFERWLVANLVREADVAGVNLSTVHRVKGREWDRVLLYGVSAGIMPHRLADDDEEERRVLHVAVTRGRREVVVLVDQTRPSPFLAEMHETATVTGAEAPAAGLGLRSSRSRPGAVPPATSVTPTEMSASSAEVFEQLRVWRRGRSQADGVPAFVVCSDKTLRAIASALPAALADLLVVEGIGPTKLEHYGDEILAVVAGDSVPS